MYCVRLTLLTFSADWMVSLLQVLDLQGMGMTPLGVNAVCLQDFSAALNLRVLNLSRLKPLELIQINVPLLLPPNLVELHLEGVLLS